MARTVYFFLFLFLFQADYLLHAQKNKAAGSSQDLTRAINNIPRINNPKHQVLVLGTPHFDLSRNSSDWKSDREIDMMSPGKQKEILEVVTALEKFKPTRICVEWEPKLDSMWNSQYQLYLKDKLELKVHETHQIAFRLAKRLGLDRVYCIDNRPKQSESLIEIEDWDKYVEETSLNTDMKIYDSLNSRFNQYVDSIKYVLPLKQYYLFGNSAAMKREYKRLWFTGLVHVGNNTTYAGADMTGTWYQRNTRIFSNVKKLCVEKQERVLILYGFSHAFILEEFFKASQQFEVVELSKLIK